MKKLFFFAAVITLVSSVCFAQQPSTPVTKVVPTPVETKTFTGKVDSVTIGDATKGIKSELVVADDNGQKISFAVNSATPITGKDGKALTLADIKKDSKVTVDYTKKASGTNKAQSIKLE